ncbi:hypothetical protein CLOM_g5841 [Closterium sp. NIES-68]|nr:hypothetical protein CLOM_g5841 [Closterium sp. NIES-68]GJP73901.1 hypothetical protein CLOP_g4571 [Closterium sp. NIES-67]
MVVAEADPFFLLSAAMCQCTVDVAPDAPGASSPSDGTPSYSPNGQPVTSLAFRGVSYSVQNKKLLQPRSKRVPKQLLCDVSAFAKAGEVTAIMGASGSGKTTLLDILSDRISSRNLTGEISLNGAPVKGDTIRRLSAYVMQDDLMFPALTVRETLMYAAELRLPPTVSAAEKAEKVRRLIRLLGLTKVAGSKIGDENSRGISGGERKRVAIGVEMIGDPEILFLDEPTSGLDSTSAFRVVKVIKRIAVRTGSIVVMVLHQPSFRLLGLLDRLLLLGAGRMLFFGQPAQLPDFLSAFGCPPPPFANPTEFALDVIQRLGHEAEGGAKCGEDVDDDDEEEDLNEEAYNEDGTENIKCHVVTTEAPADTADECGGTRQASGGCSNGETETVTKTGKLTDVAGGIQRLAEFYVIWSQGGSRDSSEGGGGGGGGSFRDSSEGGESFSIPPSSPSTCFSPDQAAVAAATAAAVAARMAAAAASAAAAAATAGAQRGAAPPGSTDGGERVAIPAGASSGGASGGLSGASPGILMRESSSISSGGGGSGSAQKGFLGEGNRAGAQTEHRGGERKYANGWWRELRVLLSRSVRVIARTPSLYLLRLLLIMVTGFLIASLFWRPPFNAEGLHERLAFISFLVCTLFFSSADATPLFIQERNIFIRETSQHAYRPSTYMVASTLVYLPLHVLMAAAITAESWWCVNLSGGAASFSFVVLVCFCCLFTGNAYATFISAAVNNVILAYAIVISTMANFALVCGFYIQRQSIPPFWIWLHYISPIKYAYEAVTLNEFASAGPSTCYQPAGDIFSATPLSVLVSRAQVNQSLAVLRPALAQSPFADISVDTCLQTGPQLLVYSLGLTQLSKWECVAVLLGMGCVLRLLHWLLLVRLSRTKRG